SWPMLRTLPAGQLVPDDTDRYDLDGVPALTEQEPEAGVVGKVAGAVDMVARIAEGCDNGTLLRLLEQPRFAALLGDEEDEGPDAEAVEDADIEEKEDGDEDAEADEGTEGGEEDLDEDDEDLDEDEDGDAWAEIGEAIRTAWPGLLKKLDECVAWRSAEDLPEPAETEAAEATAAARDEAGADEEADTEFWDEVGIMPVELMLPSGTGYTLRCYVEDEPRFLGADMTVDVFRTRDGLVAFCRAEDSHDLAGLDTWSQVREAEELDVTPPAPERYDLMAVDAQLIGGPTVADVRLVRGALDLVRDLAEYCELAGVQAALAPDSPLGNALNEIFATSVGSSILQPSYWSGEGAAAQWRRVLDEIDSCLRWHDEPAVSPRNPPEKRDRIPLLHATTC